MTDAEFMAALLSDGKPRTTMEIVAASIAERGCGLTPHSRAAELRHKGIKVECRCVGRKDGRAVYSYRLASLEEPQSSAPEDDTRMETNGGDAGRGSSSDAGSQLALELPGRVYRKDVAA